MRWSIWPSVSSLHFLSGATFEALGAALRDVNALAELEDVVVGGAVHVIEHVAGNQFTAGVVAVGVIRLDHA
jgi:hypothetical protein